MTIEPDELIDSLEKLLKNDCQIPEQYKKKTEEFFTCYNNHAERTYRTLREQVKKNKIQNFVGDKT